MAKPKPGASRGDKGKKARDQDDRALTKANKGDNVEGSFRALRRLIGGK